MTAVLPDAERARLETAARGAKPEPAAVFHFRCQRCDRLIWSRGIVTECGVCSDAGAAVYGIPLRGDISGG